LDEQLETDLPIAAMLPVISARPKLAPAAIRDDYTLAYLSRQLSLVGRREVLSGNAKFGAFGDGKELAQIALAKVFRPGDFRAGYYRDQTLALALGWITPSSFFAQLYGHPDAQADPASGGRMMGNHFASRLLDEQDGWLDQVDRFNSSADISPTAGQMPRLVGLAYASRLYREVDELRQLTRFSRNGDEVAFGTIGNASCAEGMFWEALNAIGVLRAPAVISIWDDDYGISVPNEYQLAKPDLSALLQGFRYDRRSGAGFMLYRARGWDYPTLLDVYERAAGAARADHIPTIIHVVEMTQPQGHSTSGSHERYKSHERLAWEAARDPLTVMRDWMLAEGVATAAELSEREACIRAEVEQERVAASEAFHAPIRADATELASLIDQAGQADDQIRMAGRDLRGERNPLYKQTLEAASRVLIRSRETSGTRERIRAWYQHQLAHGRQRYGAHLVDESETAARVPMVAPSYAADAPLVRGFEILRANFDALLSREPRLCIFGEDVGLLGDVNQGTAGLQEKYGLLRVSDTGIRETTIVGQAIGMAMRGLRPIAEIQYLDYVIYALPTLSDDLASLRWRTAGGQSAPAIIRTRGHRLEGIWHSGSPMGTLLHALRGMHILVPRDMTRAAGFYNTLLRGDDPALVVEVLNGYRLRERLPSNLGTFTVPLGMPETLRAGEDVTLVTYGACCRIALEAAALLDELDISLEVIDVQSLAPFDTNHAILQSLKKTSRIIFLDEDVPGGASAYMLQQAIEGQGGYWWLDAPPRTVTAQPHRPAYTTDGDYFSKPNAEDVVAAAYALMREAAPDLYPPLFDA
jgi:pyruvate/2-oxoglutarate/acetoin dehydrogenase E1 component/TPP-dependent pyruvate/acetoin dehydrogenase alpha subunit